MNLLLLKHNVSFAELCRGFNAAVLCYMKAVTAIGDDVANVGSKHHSRLTLPP